MLTWNDKVMGRFDKWLGKTPLHISLAPSQSRWGIVGLLLSTSWFFVALFFAFWAISLEGEMPMWVAFIALGLGTIVFIFLTMLSLYLLRNQGQDQTTQDISAIRKAITEDLSSELSNISKVLGEINKALEKKSGDKKK